MPSVCVCIERDVDIDIEICMYVVCIFKDRQIQEVI